MVYLEETVKMASCMMFLRGDKWRSVWGDLAITLLRF